MIREQDRVYKTGLAYAARERSTIRANDFLFARGVDIE
jgi:hypothetical protein